MRFEQKEKKRKKVSTFWQRRRVFELWLMVTKGATLRIKELKEAYS